MNLPAPRNGLQVVVVEDEHDLLALERDWNALLEDSAGTVFQSFEWISTWWKYFGGDGSLYCICFRRGNLLVGIAPLYRERVRLLGFTLVVRLQFIGRHLADYGDIMIRHGHEAEVVEAFAEHLAKGLSGWDVCDLEDLNETSPVLDHLPVHLDRNAIGLSTYQGTVCPQRSLPHSWEEFLQSIGPNLRSNLKRKQKKLEEQYQTTYEVIREDSGALEDAVTSFSEIHGDRWKSLGFPSAFDDPHHRGFHLELARRFAARGWLRLSFITVNGVRVAVSFDFNYRRRIYMYQCNAAGPDDVMRCSPGVLIKASAIRAGIAEGMEMYDFLRGDEPYKLSEWKSTNSKNYLLRLVNARQRSLLRIRAFFFRELLHKSAERVKREYFELRKFTVTQSPSFEEQINFVFARLSLLFGLGAEYLHRNLNDAPDQTGTVVHDALSSAGSGGKSDAAD
jgi:CelD/BcsL family acetyltransferase involved in cellulose biosynthesis